MKDDMNSGLILDGLVRMTRDSAISDLLASIHILHNLNENHFSREESNDYGQLIFCVSDQMIRSFLKSFHPEHSGYSCPLPIEQIKKVKPKSKK
jgi:hypothetical protein